jgi:2-oxoisovalerate dehydrogenase E1 component
VARVQEECFFDLDAPIRRVASLDMPVPFAEVLENQFLANARLESAILELAAY